MPSGSLVELSIQSNHPESLAAFLGVARTYIRTVAATKTVEHIDLHTELHTCELLTHGRHRSLERSRCHLFSVQNKRTNGCVRADIRTFVTLYTVVGFPNGDERSHTALLIFGSARIPCAVFYSFERRHLQQVAVLCVDGANHLVNERRVVVCCRFVVRQVCPRRVDGQLLVFTSAIHGCVVLIHHIFALLAVRLHDKLLHLFDSQIHGDHARDTEERRLKNGVRAVAQPYLKGNLSGVDVINGDILLSKIAFYPVRKVLCQLLAVPYGIQEERTVLAQSAGHVVHTQISLNMAGNEVRRVYKVSGTDGMVSETKMRASEAAGLLRVVREVCLAVFVGVITDDLHGVLVGTDSTVGSQAVELGFEHALAAQSYLFLLRKRREGNVVHDTDGKSVLRHRKSKVLVNGKDLRRSGILRTQAVTPAYNHRSVLHAVEAVFYIQVKGFARCTRLFRTVEHCNTFRRLGNGSQEMLCRERTVEMNGNQTDLLTLSRQIVDSLAGCFGHRTHCDNHTFSILCSVIVEQAVLTARDLGDFVHVFFHDSRNSLVVLVRRLPVLEEVVGVLCHTSSNRFLGIQCACTELGESFPVDKRCKVIVLQRFDLLYLVRRTETVEEVDERNARLDCCKVRNSCKVHNLLHGAFCQHGKTCLTCRHHILMIAEDTKRMRSQRPGRHMEHTRQQLARNLIHVRDHQQQPLGSCIGGC